MTDWNGLPPDPERNGHHWLQESGNGGKGWSPEVWDWDRHSQCWWEHGRVGLIDDHSHPWPPEAILKQRYRYLGEAIPPTPNSDTREDARTT